MRVVVIWLLAVLSGSAAEWRAGAARLELSPGHYGRAIAFADGRQNRLVVVQADTIAPSDLIIGKLLRAYDLERSQILLTGQASSEMSPAEAADTLVTLAGTALGNLKPARLDVGHGMVRVVTAGSISAALLLGGDAAAVEAAQPGMVALPLLPCEPSTPEFSAQIAANDTLRSVFTSADLPAGLHARGTIPNKLVYPVQVIRFGRAFTLVAMAGEVDPAYAARVRQLAPKERVIVIDFSNGPECYLPAKDSLGQSQTKRSALQDEQCAPFTFTDEAETRVLDAVQQALKRLR